jgi:tRNA(fMet)-specific endonuclease VapC
VTQLYLLDTNMVSYILTGRSAAARAHLAGLTGNESACISAITEGELHYSVEKSDNQRQRNALHGFLQRMPVQLWDSSAAMEYGRLRAKQEKVGKTLGPLDMQIAAHAIALGAILVTRDKGFQQIDDLPGMSNWAIDL